MLEGCGIPPRKPISWKSGLIHETTGLSYDLRRDKKTNKVLARLSRTTRIESESGTFRLVMPDLNTVQRKIKELEAQGKSVNVIAKKEEVQITKYKFNLFLDNDFRRLIIKMCVAFSRKMNMDQAIIEDSVLLFLSDSENYYQEVKLDFKHYPPLDFAIPPLAHSIDIEACPQRGRVYALVRLFGIFQFFTILHQNFQGSHFAGIGILNPLDYSERFQAIEPILHLSEPPKYVLSFLIGYYTRNMLRRFDDKILQSVGRNEYILCPGEVEMILSQICCKNF